MTAATMEMDKILAQLEAAGVRVWDRFTIAKHAKCSIHHACYLIWDHQRSQRNTRPHNRPQMRFHRKAGYRTRAATYQTGEQIIDAREVAHSLASDIDCRARSTDKDLRAILDSNPAARAAWALQLNMLQTQLQLTLTNLYSL